ncbi:hypothetical protein PTSG_07394 [Salpingoeca rosetta]|uniref:Inhibitor of growth protein n=1 Tax=Salpingoeca rosetta (strain ATCC 50818 / BSB-021) TaxID=946362 RepID=F2UIK4_SALR5|nr:uncharacterized protein PTSG_07394 [Salpingoeca rosetta]EGD77053.1 hypothetical protein PTSG_07394 [Salpingoeca rosetta]|eukprot:XP_004990893.1 hypothetical protein PTSG_07394 [Salpingoeca rosetta]
MAMVFLHDFLELNDEFSQEFKDMLKKIGDVDAEHQDHMDSARQAAEKFFKDAPKLPAEEEEARVKTWLNQLLEAKKLCQDKKAMAQHAGARLDKLLKHLDGKLLDFEKELEASNPGCTVKLKEQSLLLDTEESPYLVAKGRGYLSRGRSSMTPRKTQARKAETAAAEEEDSTLYCICRQLSHGDMIGCDNDNCEIQWFHLPCVGLTVAPEGSWYCPMCLRDMQLAAEKKKKQQQQQQQQQQQSGEPKRKKRK